MHTKNSFGLPKEFFYFNLIILKNMNDKTLIKDTTSMVDDKRIIDIEEITSPETLIKQYPLDKKTESFILTSRQIISDIISLKNDRLAVITWPCSINDPKLALDIAKKIVELKEVFPNLYPIMRVYFEKPRTTIWWKWLINDPFLDDSCDIEEWLKIARELLLKINQMWVPTAVEFLDVINPQYFADLVHWWAIWARTTESQIHRELASGLSMPVWFKNGTNWDIQIAIDAIKAAEWSHRFISNTKVWKTARITTAWNPDWHIILRWWNNWTNYDRISVSNTIDRLEKAWIENWIIIDFSHANSQKNHKNQPIVSEKVATQIAEWNKKIVWVMIESNLKEWAQSHTPWKDDPKNIEYGVSITDKCVDWETNLEMMKKLNEAVWVRNEK